MTEIEFRELIKNISSLKRQYTTIALKRDNGDSIERLYDTLSNFSNTKGGVIIFGINDKKGYKIEGVNDIQTLERKITEQCDLMEPKVRPLFSVLTYEDKTLCAAEIPELDQLLKPCYYKGKGKHNGSYIRVGDADLPMSDFEIYSLDSYKNKEENELRTKSRIDRSFLSSRLINLYIEKLIQIKPNLLNVDNETILKLEGIIDKDGNPTLCGIMNFGTYPQYFSPNLCIIATKCYGTEYAKEYIDGQRFFDNKRIDGTIKDMLQVAMAFVTQNTRTSTYINPVTCLREDKTEYPIKAIREIILNALIHRDYSIHTENEPIRLTIYSNRIEVTSPGSLYGRLTLEELGKTRSDIRNPFIALILETLEITENRYSGIPTIIEEMKKANLMAPVFEDCRGTFKVTLFNKEIKKDNEKDISSKIIEKCKSPQSKESLAKDFGFDEKHPSYFINKYIKPLIDEGILKFTIPDKPKSKNQKIVIA